MIPSLAFANLFLEVVPTASGISLSEAEVPMKNDQLSTVDTSIAHDLQLLDGAASKNSGRILSLEKEWVAAVTGGRREGVGQAVLDDLTYTTKRQY